jgi:DNA-binding LytR/AlgR family response regulator
LKTIFYNHHHALKEINAMTHAIATHRSHMLVHSIHSDAPSAAPESGAVSIPFAPLQEQDSKQQSGKIILPTMEGLCFEKIKHITHLEASGNYTLLHFRDGRQVLVCRSLCEIEAQLPGSAFVRIHRSHTVHLRHLKKYIRGKGGSVVLHNGTTLTVSAGQKDHFLDALKNYFM